MKRIIVLALLAGAITAIAVLGTGASDNKGDRYWVQLDNAFGLTDGADLKIAGVRAGKVTAMKLDRRNMKALIGVEVTQNGFDDLRKDVQCETRPQSLIGEYFIDCRPGTSPVRLKPGDTIPVEQTQTTVPLDLINNIMRRPYRERFSILLSQLGAGLAARGPDLNETIRRAVPALRQVDRLLAILRDQRKVISTLYRDADRVFARVAASATRSPASSRRRATPPRRRRPSRTASASSGACCRASSRSSSRRWPTSRTPPTPRSRR
jgi:ABC-type transporter Mla subunit MlaD